MLALLTVAAACTSAHPADAPARVRPGFLTHAGKPNVVVFVHGVTGDAAATWRNPATGASWPEMITRDPELADFDVYLAGFDSPLLGRSSTIEEIAQRLLVQLTDDGVFDRYAQVHFITHSMGGLITKRMLIELNRPQPREQDRLRRVRAVLFVSTPAQGAEVAKIGAWLSQNPQFANMEPATFNAFLQSLENQWQALLRDRDERDVSFPRVFCAYETKPLAAGVVVVSRVYAATRCDDTPIAFDADHSAIVKPADERTQPYPWATARLRETSRLPAVAVARGREFRLTVELSEVVNDAKGRQIEAHRFTGPAVGEAPDATLDEAAAWLATRLGQIYELDRPQATFRVRVPADPGREPVVVERIGEAPVDIELYLVEGGAKARMPLDRNALAAIQRDFDMEINVPGYAGVVRRVTWGRPFDEAFSLTPTPLQVGVEEFAGDTALATRLSERLGRHPRLQIKPPAVLADLRREIQANRELLARSPAVQMALRRSLGLDVLVSGRYDRVP